MKKVITTIALLLLFTFVTSNAAVHVFQPNPVDAYDLDHYRAYTWGIDWDFGDEEISSVILTFDNIRNWNDEPNSLFIRMLDDAPAGLITFPDGDPTLNDYFDGEGLLIDAWTDLAPTGYYGTGITLSYNFGDLGILPQFIDYTSNDNFGFAFDPDCHYWNDGISLTVITDAPEPATIFLLSLGLAGGYFLNRKK